MHNIVVPRVVMKYYIWTDKFVVNQALKHTEVTVGDN